MYKLLRIAWKTSQLPPSLALAEGCFVPKETNSTGIDTFREISLLDVETNIFWAVVARSLTTFVLANNYINPSVQKGGVPGHSGCLEHVCLSL